MKKLLTVLVLAGAVLPVVILAQDEPGTVDYKQVLQNVRVALWSIFVVLAVIMFVWAGILYLTASGDPEKVGKAKTAVIYGVVGIAVAVIGYSIVTIVMQIMGA